MTLREKNLLRIGRLVWLGVCLAGGAIGLRGAEPPGTLAVARRANANVSLAARGTVVVAAWSASIPSGATDIFTSVSEDSGTTFTAPVRVNQMAGQASVNGEQPPRVTLVEHRSAPELKLGPTGSRFDIVVVWTAKGSNGTMLLTTRSVDGGRTFGSSTRVPGGDAPGNRGWEAVGADSSGRVSAVWLDHRELAKTGDAMAAMHHETGPAAPARAHADAAAEGVAKAQLSKLYFAALDGSSPGRPIAAGVCYCCKTALATGAGGLVAVAWRHVYPGNLRDIAFMLSRDGGRTFGPQIRVSEDKWELEGCPDDGPAMMLDAQGAAHVVWPTMVTERGTQTIALFEATSRDGKTFSPRVKLPTEGLPHHPQLAIAANGATVLAWDELVAGQRRVVSAQGRTGANGQVTFARRILGAGAPAVYPAMAATPAGVLTAWTSGAPETSVIRMDRQ